MRVPLSPLLRQSSLEPLDCLQLPLAFWRAHESVNVRGEVLAAPACYVSTTTPQEVGEVRGCKRTHTAHTVFVNVRAHVSRKRWREHSLSLHLP